jgi:RNA polymerase sigma-70 factor (ECF subfamily)
MISLTVHHYASAHGVIRGMRNFFEFFLPPARNLCETSVLECVMSTISALRGFDLPSCNPIYAGALTMKVGGPGRAARGYDLAKDIKDDLIALLPRLRRFARSLTRSVPEADDLVQDACLRALGRVDQWDPAQPLDRWVFRIMRNLWISEIRKRQVRLGQGHVPADESHELVSFETGEATAIAADLHSQINALPDELSAILLSVSVEGYSYAEAAALFDIPIGTVMSRVHRARKTLAAQMAVSEGAST